MSSRKSDASASGARFAPINDSPATSTIATPSPGLAKPSMDTSMPPPSLPPPGLAQTPEAVHPPRPTSSSAAAAHASGAEPSQSTPSEKSKDDEKKTSGGGHPKEAVTIPIEELQLPKSIITRLAKGVLPPNTQIQANAILAMTKSATVFINHLANAANEVTTLQNKKTVMPADVFRALDDIEFGFMRERVEAEFAKFNEVQTSKRSTYRKKVAAAKKATKGDGEDGAEASIAGADGDTKMGGGDTTVNSVADTSAAGGGGGQPRAKKARTDGSNGDQMDVDEEVADASDPESVPDEEGDGAEDEDEEEADEEDEEEDEGDEAENGDELEERQGRPDEDEALDDGNNSD